MNRLWGAAFLLSLALPVMGGVWLLWRGSGFEIVQPVVTIIQIGAVLVLLALRWRQTA